ncbi:MULTISPECIES: hypothetical protein [unclassified Novosphingobium]|nr:MULTISPECIES: hypothetical protein [unclassified Novosphingobium]
MAIEWQCIVEGKAANRPALRAVVAGTAHAVRIVSRLQIKVQLCE